MFHEKVGFVFIGIQTAEPNWQLFAYSRQAANRKRYFYKERKTLKLFLEHTEAKL